MRALAGPSSALSRPVLRQCHRGLKADVPKIDGLMRIADLTDAQFSGLLATAAALKSDFYAHPAAAAALRPLAGRTMASIFQKRSTRTRVSTEVGMFKLGGHALFLSPADVQLGVNESMRDTARVLSRFNDVILARVFAHADVEELAAEATVPVINALSDRYHPLQALADVMTLQEHFGPDLAGRTLTWVGDGNNVIHDLAMAAAKAGMCVRVATPPGYEAERPLMLEAAEVATSKGNSLSLHCEDPVGACNRTDVVVTDTWVSMGQEEEAARRLRDFDGWQVDARMMGAANKDAVFMHCLPRHAEEVTDEVFYGSRSVVFPEAENRLWTFMAVALATTKAEWELA
eukprot:CAMPEP_0198438906 /NCGR_PEP_ID=MMETSP1452-20131203/52870_1 /TAXON_ID=1181717 /ORGANISM="Synchroma pusillum, Strain CCMP3072" /LENGTH=345 /DNA_ID=CAMNT_0044159501 /DNA_START=15 /DNA_END=1052 /DNA_ORIENTATION=+